MRIKYFLLVLLSIKVVCESKFKKTRSSVKSRLEFEKKGVKPAELELNDPYKPAHCLRHGKGHGLNLQLEDCLSKLKKTSRTSSSLTSTVHSLPFILLIFLELVNLIHTLFQSTLNSLTDRFSLFYLRVSLGLLLRTKLGRLNSSVSVLKGDKSIT